MKGRQVSESGNLKSFQLDRDGALQKFDRDDEEFLFIVGLQHQTFDPFERAVDDPGRFTDFWILELLHLHPRLDDPLNRIDLLIGDRERFRAPGLPRMRTTPKVLRTSTLVVLSRERSSTKMYPGNMGISILFRRSFRLLQTSILGKKE